MPTTKHKNNPNPIQAQGIIKPPPINEVTILPTTIPKIIPPIPPNWHITNASIKNCLFIFSCVAPNDFLIPISLVRSVTETNIIFINPMAAPNKVINPITVAAMVIKLS